MKIAKNVTELIGHTPLVRLNKVTEGCVAEVVAKLESQNPLASVKDRIGVSMIEEAERAGKIQPGKTVLIEPTSGNTGIGLAFVAAVKGYKLILTMPDTMSLERRVLLLAFGAEIVLTPGPRGMKGAMRKPRRFSRRLRTATCCSSSTIPRIPRFTSKLPGPRSGTTPTARVDILISGVGTGGTITGVSRIHQAEEAVFQGDRGRADRECGAFRWQALSAQNSGHRRRLRSRASCARDYIDEVVTVTNDEAIAMARRLPKEEGLLVGISSGAAVVAALQVARRPENAGKLIVVVLPVFGERYLSSILFQELREKALQIPTAELLPA